jgi:hypothetical protein
MSETIYNIQIKHLRKQCKHISKTCVCTKPPSVGSETSVGPTKPFPLAQMLGVIETQPETE